ncbi:MAG: PLP-dependent aminotransferase family protein [Candidatus Zixiibacteriota bacterium]|nr:MAG: PLP-dependent aminotransferase family protein [candidate division Zixibacteria bacterium]
MLTGIIEQVDPAKWKLAPHVTELEASIIREILKITTRPGVISFAGGLPAPELFPIETVKELAAYVLDTYGAAAMQYSLSAGITPLRELLAERATGRGTASRTENILITAGAQQGIELLGRAFIAPGDYVLVENPTYLGALQVFNYYRAQYCVVEMDDEGMLIDQVEKQLETYHPKLIYTVSNFQNPTGITMSVERRKALIEIAGRYNVPIIDDNPYGELQFSDERIPTLKSIGGDEVVALRTFSKLVSPGFRVGWMNGPTEVIEQFEKVKQCVDLHANTFAQYLMLEFIKQGYLEPHVEKIRADYKAKRDTMLAALAEYFPPEITWTRPEGGMFIWLRLPSKLSAKELLNKAVERQVAYVYGEPFYPLGGGEHTMRLNYSNATHETIREGIKRLGDLFKAELAG